jgi:phosphatidate cytidylyltransferase
MCYGLILRQSICERQLTISLTGSDALADAETPKKNSDLPVRLASAVVMVAIAGTALWLGGWWWIGFVAAIGCGVVFEWYKLAKALSGNVMKFIIWLVLGAIYIAVGIGTLIRSRVDIDRLLSPPEPDGLVDLWSYPTLYEMWPVLTLVLAVVAVDAGAYFAGRAIGGPKIAPKISPSKTWAGLVGGVLTTWIALVALYWIFVTYVEFCDFAPLCEFSVSRVLGLLIAATIIGVVAQAGDFFQSWMKRKAGVKDSGNLIPGHGGLFDRVDGLLAVSFVVGITQLIAVAVIQ